MLPHYVFRHLLKIGVKTGKFIQQAKGVIFPVFTPIKKNKTGPAANEERPILDRSLVHIHIKSLFRNKKSTQRNSTYTKSRNGEEQFCKPATHLNVPPAWASLGLSLWLRSGSTLDIRRLGLDHIDCVDFGGTGTGKSRALYESLHPASM